MVTINGKRYTKKMGQAILRTQDRTAIFKLYKQLTGKIDRGEIFEFIKNYAPSKKVAKAAFSIAYNSPHQSVIATRANTAFRAVAKTEGS